MKRKKKILTAIARLIHLIGDLYDDYKRRQRQKRRQAIKDDPDAAWNDRFGVRDDSDRE